MHGGTRASRRAVQLKGRVAEMRRCGSGVAVTLEAQSPPLCQKRKAVVESPPLRIEGSGTPPAAAASAITLSLFRLQRRDEDEWSVASGQWPFVCQCKETAALVVCDGHSGRGRHCINWQQQQQQQQKQKWRRRAKQDAGQMLIDWASAGSLDDGRCVMGRRLCRVIPAALQIEKEPWSQRW
jgi:hypothetical protein